VLIKTLGHCDDDAVARILSGCRAVCPDATEAEIAHFIEFHGSRFQKMHSIGNPMGMLIRHLPNCFQGESFLRYRQAEQQRREAEAVQRAELRKEWQRIADDETAPDEDRKWARELLSIEEA
jgi:hypothetical protein